MPHETSLIATIAVSLAFAFIGGLIAVRFRLPPLVDYLLAGIAVGPFTPGYVADIHLAPQLAEIGVIFLMFGVGMHFSVRGLWEVRDIALPGALVQIAVATMLGIGVAYLWGWSFGAGLVLGLALSVASTAVLLRALETHGLVDTNNGKIAIGWLIVEDLIMVLVLVILPPFSEALSGRTSESYIASPFGIIANLSLTLGKVVLFVAFMLLGGTRFFPWLLKKVEKTGIRELFTLAVIAIGLGVAFGSAKFFGVSFALGAFFAGIVINESDFSHRAVTDTQPLQDAFAVLFFVSVGMLFDPSTLVKQPFQVLVVLMVIVFGKSLAAFTIVRALRFSSSTALIVSGALAQIGEFSFILAGLGVNLGLLSLEGQSLILAGALLSITLNPLAFSLAKKMG
jgi:CPA2 family monovalent cation:H+ antiporter-2